MIMLSAMDMEIVMMDNAIVTVTGVVRLTVQVTYYAHLDYVCNLGMFNDYVDKWRWRWSKILRIFWQRRFCNQDVWPIFDILLLAKSMTFKILVCR